MCRSPIYYYGGKGRVVKKIINIIPEHISFVEVCAGSAAVLLAKEPSKFEVINDISSEIVDLFKCLQDDTEKTKLYHMIQYTPFSRQLFEEWLGKSFTVNDPLHFRAYRTFLLANQSHGGKLHKLYPYDFRLSLSNKAIQDFNRKVSFLNQVVERIKKVVVEHLDFEILLKKYDKAANTVFYIDPPYPCELRDKSKTGMYGEYEMTIKEHQRLLDCVKNLRSKVMISGYSGDAYEQLNWRKEVIPTKCLMNLGEKSSHREEVVFCNW